MSDFVIFIRKTNEGRFEESEYINKRLYSYDKSKGIIQSIPRGCTEKYLEDMSNPGEYTYDARRCFCWKYELKNPIAQEVVDKCWEEMNNEAFG